MTVPRTSRLHESSIPAGTSVRFAQLIVLMVISTGTIAARFLDPGDSDWAGCMSAGGVDLERPSLGGRFNVYIDQGAAFDQCVDQYVSSPPIWLGPLWIAVCLVAAAALFNLLPRWRTRSSRVASLSLNPLDSDARERIRHLMEQAAMSRMPKIVIDRLAPTAGAAVFGSTRKPILRINGGLLTKLHSNPALFDAVILHELAHIRNLDITITYASVSIWRVFIALVALPALLSDILYTPSAIQGPWARTEISIIPFNQISVFVLIALTYLARLEVLRSRELYADQTAAHWGADPSPWAVPEPIRHLRAKFWNRVSVLWRTHPDPVERRSILTDPEGLFRLRLLQFFLTGTASIMLVDQLADSRFIEIGRSAQWDWLLIALPAAVLITAVVGVAVWRSILYSSQVSRARATTGIRIGLWLGTGMIAGQMVSSRIAAESWMPKYPAALLLLIPVAVGFAWWLSQCARIWAERWQGRLLVPATLTLIAASVVMMQLLAFWTFDGSGLTDGTLTDPASVSQYFMTLLGASPDYHYSTSLTVFSAVLPNLSFVVTSPLAWTTVAILWMVPLAAWALPIATRSDNLRHAGNDLPPLRPVIYAALAGGVVTLATLFGLKAYMRPWARSLGGTQENLDFYIYSGWAVTAVLIGALVAAVTAGWLTGRFRLATALIASQGAASLGLAFFFLVTQTDGCHGALNVFRSDCGFEPGIAWTPYRAALTLVTLNMSICLAGAALTGFIGAAIASGLRRMWPSGKLLPGRMRPERRTFAGRSPRSWGVIAVCALAAGFVLTAEAIQVAESDHQTPSSATMAILVDDISPHSPESKAYQLSAWWHYGGDDLAERMGTTLIELGSVLNVDEIEEFSWGHIEEVCIDLQATTEDAQQYFTIPDEEAQQDWATILGLWEAASSDCYKGAVQKDLDLIIEASGKFSESIPLLERTESRFSEFF
jgi:Zn-dependent protease with chaperone function